jgi:uncharacterized glyoxalase superfamily protein PhnB
MPVKPAIIPSFSFVDAPTAIRFLCDAFGFTEHAVYRDEKDPNFIHHAQLVLDGNMIMLGSVRDTEYSRKVGLRSVAEAGGNTLGIYVVIDDVDGHADRARAAGADIVMEPEDQDYGGRVYSARDCEGHAWSFGSYDPWAG